MSTQPYKAAIIGLGNIAWKFDRNLANDKNAPQTHAGAYQAHKNTIIVGGCSPKEQDRVSFAQQYRVGVFENVDELLDQTNPDIVSVCSPSELHYQYTLQCLEAQIPMIWLEKPPACNLEDINRLIEKQEHSKSTILANFQRRYCHCYNRLKELYVNQTLGKTEFIHLNYSKGLLLNGSHIIDILFYILGDDLHFSLEGVMSSENVENPAFALRVSNGPRIFVAGTSLPYHCLDIVLTCREGRASILYGGMQTKLETKVEHELFSGFYRLKEQSIHQLGSEDLNGAMSEALSDLIVSHRQKKEPRSTLRTSRNTLVIIDTVEQAMEAAR